MPVAAAIGIAVASVSVIVLAFLHPVRSWYRNRGAPEDEVNDGTPGDEEVSEANNVVTAATMIDSPAGDVIPTRSRPDRPVRRTEPGRSPLLIIKEPGLQVPGGILAWCSKRLASSRETCG